jgi:hypothetical protein
LQDKAVVLLGQTLDALFTRDADGLRSEVVDGLVWALRILAGMGDSKARQQLVLRAALLGQSGIDLLEADLKTRPKGDSVKVALAARLRAETTMTVGWIAERLAMGTRGYLNHLLYRRRKPGGE